MTRVSVIVPILNERAHIERCVASLQAQDHVNLEVLVVDGGSTDGSRELVQRLAESDGRIRLLDNPQKLAASAMNIGWQAATGDIVMRLDGHAWAAPDFVSQSLKVMAETGADCVGGAIETVTQTPEAAAISAAMSSPFGVGNARFRYARSAGWVDTLAFGAYRRDLIERIGPFDESLVRNQDDEFNLRLTLSGGRIWLDPRIKSWYVSRSSLKRLWRQYFDYGFWKIRVIRKHRLIYGWRHLVPGALVLALAGGVIALPWSMLPLALAGGSYLSAVAVASVVTAAQKGWSLFLRLPPTFMTLHLAYGLGFWKGILNFSSGLPKR